MATDSGTLIEGQRQSTSVLCVSADGFGSNNPQTAIQNYMSEFVSNSYTMRTPSRSSPRKISPSDVVDLDQSDEPVPLERGNWYETDSGDGELHYVLKDGLTAEDYLYFDILQTGSLPSVFELLFTDESGSLLGSIPELIWSRSNEKFIMNIRTLPGCAARVRIPLGDLLEHRVKRSREGAWLSSYLGGTQIHPEKVERIVVRVKETRGNQTRWCQSPLSISATEPPENHSPASTVDHLLDPFGQCATQSVPNKIDDVPELTDHLCSRPSPSDVEWPEEVSEWGGWAPEQFEGTGYFRTHHDGDRWWLLDPDGHPFWSAGVSTVRPIIESAYGGLEEHLEWLPDETGKFADAHVDDVDPVQDTHSDEHGPTFNYLGANLIRAFGPEDWKREWKTTIRAELRDMGFNTIGAWSDPTLHEDGSLPYTRTLEYTFPDVPNVHSDFPDIHHPAFESALDAYAKPLEETAECSSLIGYFLGNYPDWTLLQHSLAEGMVTNGRTSHSHDWLASELESVYGTNATLQKQWNTDVTFEAIRAGEVSEITGAAEDDLREYSRELVGQLIERMTNKCKEHDPNHLNLGIRFAEVPPAWAHPCLDCIDVLTVYSYSSTLEGSDATDRFVSLSREYDLPVLIGEWQFGTTASPTHSPGLCPVSTQSDRGDAIRVYLEDAVSRPWCVGAHYFRLYDHSAIGGRHGENFNIGIFDTCQQRYDPVATAFRESHERLYRVATGECEPYDDGPDYE